MAKATAGIWLHVGNEDSSWMLFTFGKHLEKEKMVGSGAWDYTRAISFLTSLRQ